jgi:hypothetical protein
MSALLAVAVALEDEGETGMTAHLQVVGRSERRTIRISRSIPIDPDDSLLNQMGEVTAELDGMAAELAEDLSAL